MPSIILGTGDRAVNKRGEKYLSSMNSFIYLLINKMPSDKSLGEKLRGKEDRSIGLETENMMG